MKGFLEGVMIVNLEADGDELIEVHKGRLHPSGATKPRHVSSGRVNLEAGPTESLPRLAQREAEQKEMPRTVKMLIKSRRTCRTYAAI